jgi:hypothetical protein
VAYKLDLKGPALNIVTACSTSLVAVATAVQSLSTWQCDMALAGGVSITLPQKRGYLWQEGAITSPDGQCRAFDVHAEGTVFGNGLGIVVLRRLADAIAANDRIYAVIKGAALNNDGSAKVSFTARASRATRNSSQLRRLLPASIPIQSPPHRSSWHWHEPRRSDRDRRLTQAFQPGFRSAMRNRAIGALKTNIGHLTRRRAGRSHQDGPSAAQPHAAGNVAFPSPQPEARSRQHTVRCEHAMPAVGCRWPSSPRWCEFFRCRRDQRPCRARGGPRSRAFRSRALQPPHCPFKPDPGRSR